MARSRDWDSLAFRVLAEPGREARDLFGFVGAWAPPVADVATMFGYVWAGLMFGSAALNIALALSLDPKSWAAAMSAWGLASKIGLFLIQYAAMTAIGRRRGRAAAAVSA